MKKLPVAALSALLIGVALTLSARESSAQRVRNPWAFVAADSYARLYFLKDSVVEEENHVRVAWIRITYKEVRQHGMATGYSPEHNVLEVRYRFDCPAHRVLQLESRERMDDTIVHEHPANPDAEWQRHNDNRVIRDVWRRLC
jgi:hypothetical protein